MAGGTYFFTVNLAERKRTLLVEHGHVLRAVMQKVKAMHPFHIDAMVILPDHLHALWTLPVGDSDYPTRWMLIKTGFSRQIPKNERRSESRQAKGNGASGNGVTGMIRDEQDYARPVDYLHYNPVKHGLVKRVADWPHSTFHRYVTARVYTSEWAGNEVLDGEDFGE